MHDGGSAFPRRLPDCKVSPDRAVEMIQEYAGMSLRQFYAGLIMAGLRASGQPAGDAGMAAHARRDADALIAELERTDEDNPKA